MRCDVDDLAASAPVIMFDNASGVVSGDGWSVRLVRRQAQIFEALWHAKGRMVTSTQLVELIYSIDDEPGDPENVISSHIHHLRKQIEPHGILIRSARFQGYRIELSSGTRQELAPVALGDIAFYRSVSVVISDASVVSALCALANQHSCLPQHIALALLKAVVAADLVDAVLDGDSPQAFVRVPMLQTGEAWVAPRRAALRLGVVQKAVLGWFADHDPDFSASAGLVTQELRLPKGQAYQIIKSLMDRGCLAIAEQGKRGTATLYRLVRSDVV